MEENEPIKSVTPSEGGTEKQEVKKEQKPNLFGIYTPDVQQGMRDRKAKKAKAKTEGGYPQANLAVGLEEQGEKARRWMKGISADLAKEAGKIIKPKKKSKKLESEPLDETLLEHDAKVDEYRDYLKGRIRSD